MSHLLIKGLRFDSGVVPEGVPSRYAVVLSHQVAGTEGRCYRVGHADSWQFLVVLLILVQLGELLVVLKALEVVGSLLMVEGQRFRLSPVVFLGLEHVS